MDFHRPVADAQVLADLFAGQAVHQAGGHLAFAGRQRGAHRPACAQVLEAPDARRVRVGRVQRASGHVAPESLALEAAVHPLHDALVGVGATAPEDGHDALAGAFVFVGAGVEEAKALSHQLFA